MHPGHMNTSEQSLATDFRFARYTDK